MMVHFEEFSGPNAFFRSFSNNLGLAVAGVTPIGL